MGIVDVDVGELLGNIGSAAKGIRSAITGEMDPDVKAKLESKALELDGLVLLAQIKVNETEAKHSSLFVSGWRPFIGWVCGGALVYHFILNRLIEWIVALSMEAGELSLMPVFDLGDLIVILGGLLGLSGMRSYEKGKKVARS